MLTLNEDVLSKDFMTDDLIIQHASLKNAWVQHKPLELETSVGSWRIQNLVELIYSTGQNHLPNGHYLSLMVTFTRLGDCTVC